MNPEKIEIFKIPEATKPLEPEFNEVHRQGYLEIDEERIKPTRETICSEFNIPKEVQFIRLIKSGYQRKITSFLVLESKENPKDIYYAEGNTNHADLLNDIINKAGTGLESRKEIQENLEEFDRVWEVKKGFIDPFANGFKNYPELRKKLERLQKEKAIKDGKKQEESREIPNWFLAT